MTLCGGFNSLSVEDTLANNVNGKIDGQSPLSRDR